MQEKYSLIKRSRNRMLASALVFLLIAFSNRAQGQTYCAAANTDVNAAGSLMSNVTFGSINNTTGSVWTSPSGYNYYSSLTTTVVLGTNENLTISIDPPATYTGAIISVWFDWDHDGTLAASEWTQVGTNMTNTGSPYTISIAIPPTATPGTTRMRIRSRGAGNTNGSGDACTSMGSGETEDYDINVVPPTACSGTPTAGNAVVNPHNMCLGQTVNLTLTGSTIASGLSYQWETASSPSGPWTPVGASLTVPNTTNTPTGSGTIYFHAVVTCGSASATSAYDSVIIPAPFPGGTYTIDPTQPASSTNFQSFSAAVSAIGCGITGPIVFNVAATTTPFNEQVTIPSTVGATATNTVTFNCNGDTLTFAGTTAAPWTLGLNGADFFTFNNLNVVGTTSTAALVGHLWNQADSNTFNNCTFSAPANTTSTAAVAFSVSGSATSGTTTGLSGNGNTLNGCTMFSGYYNTVFYGNSAGANTGNKVINCKLRDFYFYGLYSYYQVGMTITGDTVERPTRTTLSTFYGMYLTTASAGALVERNVIRNPFGAAPTNTGTAYGIYMVVAASSTNGHQINNNLIHLSTGNGTKYGLYLGGNYVSAYHNTVVIDNTTSSASLMHGIYATGTTGVAIRNNNVVITQPGTSTKYGLYYTGTGKNSNYNNIYVNSAGGTNYIGYYSTTSTGAVSLAAWQAVATNAFDSASISENPVFAAGTYVPTSGLMENKGTPVGILTDITGAARNTPPDIGAYEFTTPSCFGQPTAGTATGPVSGMVCPNSPFSIMLSGTTVDAGISIQWQSSPAGVGIWQNIPGATSSMYTEAAGINTPTDFQAIVTCANGGGQDISNLVSLSISPWQTCYCVPNTGGGTTYYISNFTTTNAASNINNTVASGSATGYQDFTGTPALIVVPGTVVNYTMNIAGGSTYGAAIWIDTNMDGTFQSTEQFLITSSYASSPITGTFTIPATANLGTTRMRILAAFTPSNPTNPCLNTGSGEYQDYMINIFVPSTCFGTPVAGTAYGVPDSTCAGIPFTLSDTSATLATGITYQWQESPHGAATWTDISGATTSSYTLTAGVTAPTDFRLVVSCTPSGNGDTSNVEEVFHIYTPSQCYCTPTTNGGSTTYYISNFTTTGATSDINVSSTSGNSAGYKDLTATPALVATPGGVFNYSMNVAGGSTYGAAIWIDTNMDGTFQSNEQFLTTSAYAFPPITGTITLPVTATQGTTRMRILAAFTPSNPTNPCANSGSGEFQDFTFIIGPPPTCPAPSSLTATNPTATSVDLGWTSTATQWQIEYAPGNTFTIGSGTRVGPSGLTNPYTVGSLLPQQYSFFVRSICAPGDTSFWSQRQVFFPLPPNDACANAIDISNGMPVNGYVNFATQSEPACDATALANDVWYVFTTGSAATTAVINVNTSVTGTDVVMQAFSGTCGSLTPMIPTSSSGTGTSGCVDGPAAGLETATYTVTPNTTYYVRVYGFNTIQGTFPIQLAIPPPNDDICDAINLVIDDPVPSCVNTQFATVGANDPANACSSNNNTVWYKFTPTVAQPYYIISTVPAASTDPLGAWIFTFTATGSCPGALTLTAAGGIGTTCQSTQYPATAGAVTSFTTASLTANTTYYLFVDGNSSDVGDICFQVLSNPLSIKLADIRASNIDSRNRINWNSASEERGDYYELERSADGNSFSKLSTVDGKGQASAYTYWDETPLNGINYYRLKMVDAAGNVQYSKVVTATVKGSGEFALEAFPNPVSDQLTVKAYGSSGNATVTITDATGKLVKMVSMDNGMALVDMKGLAQGIYLVKYTDNDHSQTIKVNKQ